MMATYPSPRTPQTHQYCTTSPQPWLFIAHALHQDQHDRDDRDQFGHDPADEQRDADKVYFHQVPREFNKSYLSNGKKETVPFLMDLASTEISCFRQSSFVSLERVTRA